MTTHVTVRNLFGRIAGTQQAITKDGLESFLEKAGVPNGWLSPFASMAATSVMDKFDPAGKGQVSYDEFAKRAVELVPPHIMAGVSGAKADAVLSERWSELDPRGSGAVTTVQLRGALEAQLAAKGQMFAGTKAEAAASVLVAALDANGDGMLQKSELEGFVKDVLRESGKG
jgi:hypothetical protein